MKIPHYKLLLLVLFIVGCYSINQFNPLYNQNVDALKPYKDCELKCKNTGNVHCHWNIGGVENHGWIEEKCNYDLCLCMLECISDSHKIATKSEAILFCNINNQWVQNGEDGNIFYYDSWKEHYLEQEKDE